MRRLLACIVLALTGCGGLDAREPLPARVGEAQNGLVLGSVTSSCVASDPHAFNTPGRFAANVDCGAIGGRVSELLAERHGPKGTGQVVDPPPSRFVVEATVTRADVKYEGQTGIFPLKIFFTVFFFPIDFPNYFISSDKFALVLQAKWKVLEKGQNIAEGTVEGRQGGRFGDFSRGWYFVGYLRMPGPLKGDEFQEISEALLPGAQDALAEALVVEVEKALDEKK